ncbi:MAG: hypothetical protein U1E19_10830 [Rhodoblastus sp.]
MIIIGNYGASATCIMAGDGARRAKIGAISFKPTNQTDGCLSATFKEILEHWGSRTPHVADYELSPASGMTVPTASQPDGAGGGQMQTFNAEILKAVVAINTKWGVRATTFTVISPTTFLRPDCCVKANHPPKTMCVAAVTEIIIEALNGYYALRPVTRRLSRNCRMSERRGGSKKDIRAHVFMYEGLAQGTAHALERFGPVPGPLFEQLELGSFTTNLNRKKSGHACVFLAYLDATGNEVEETYGPGVVGVRGTSSQGKDLAGWRLRIPVGSTATA